MARKARVAVMLSGNGTTMSSLLFHSRLADCPYEIVLVASNVPEARGLAIAAAEGVAAFAHSHKGLAREAHEAIMDKALRDAGAEFIALAGYMRVLTEGFVDKWSGRMLNTHPSLLPKFKGLHTHQRAIEAGEAHGAFDAMMHHALVTLHRFADRLPGEHDLQRPRHSEFEIVGSVGNSPTRVPVRPGGNIVNLVAGLHDDVTLVMDFHLMLAPWFERSGRHHQREFRTTATHQARTPVVVLEDFGRLSVDSRGRNGHEGRDLDGNRGCRNVHLDFVAGHGLE